MRSIVIVGAGFSGTMVAAWLLRSGNAARVTLLDSSGSFGKGLAYGRARRSHVLNVPAGRMGAWAGKEGDFLEWLRARDPGSVGGAFVQRSIYGEYLSDLLSRAEQEAAPGSLQRDPSRAVGATVEPDGKVRVMLDSGRTVSADALVLALGNFAPSNLPLSDPLAFSSARYVSDPWLQGALHGIAPTDSVLLIGTGLTMYDIALELRDRGHQGRLVAVSRRGLLPQPHRATHGKPAHHEPPAGHAHWPSTTLGMLRAVRTEVRKAAAHGLDWREVVTSLRPITAELWGRLDLRERQRFLSRVRPFWDTHRHRAAPEVDEAIEALLHSGRMSVQAATLVSMKDTGSEVVVIVRPRGVPASEELRVERVINCTGPEMDCSRGGGRFMQDLLKKRLVQCDPLRMGLVSDTRGRAIGADGRASAPIWMIGPLRRPELWESTAVPELREQAAALSRSILDHAP